MCKREQALEIPDCAADLSFLTFKWATQDKDTAQMFTSKNALLSSQM